MRKTPLERWTATKMFHGVGRPFTESDMRQFQLEKLRHTISCVKQRSPFYRKRLADFDARDLANLTDMADLPFTSPRDLVENGLQMVCVSQSQIERVVTLQFPGMMGDSRRSYFSGEDLELTIDFFRCGMSTFVEPGQKVLIMMPGNLPGSVGDLLTRALDRIRAQGIVHGMVGDPAEAIQDIIRHEIDCLVRVPSQVLGLAKQPLAQEIPAGRIKSILLSADNVPAVVIRDLRATWDCSVFTHYGSTEMGYGGGVECEASSGYHLREADLYFEIINPDSGRPLPVGKKGEIVFTTLTRTGMPLIRYRTGDLSRLVPEPCPCGTVLPRLERIAARIHDLVRLRTGEWLGIADLDEALFSLPGVVDYNAAFRSGSAVDELTVSLHIASEDHVPACRAVEAAILTVPQVGQAVARGLLLLEAVQFAKCDYVASTAVKRAIRRVEIEEGVG